MVSVFSPVEDEEAISIKQTNKQTPTFPARGHAVVSVKREDLQGITQSFQP